MWWQIPVIIVLAVWLLILVLVHAVEKGLDRFGSLEMGAYFKLAGKKEKGTENEKAD